MSRLREDRRSAPRDRVLRARGAERTRAEFEAADHVIQLSGGGEEGIGEDVTYDALDHIALQDAGPVLDLAGAHTLGEFCELLDGLDLFPAEPGARGLAPLPALGLRVGGARPGAAPGGHAAARGARPRAAAGQLRLLDAAVARRRRRLLDRAAPPRLELYPTLRFKLDPTNDWTDELIAELVETGAVDSLDLKGLYKGTPVDVETDPELYAKLIEAFPEPGSRTPTSTRRPGRCSSRSRPVTWDAPIHSIADIEALPWPPKMVNVKPSRFGALRDLFAAYDYCERARDRRLRRRPEGARPGRGQIQYLASLFHPDTPNDVAPSGYNDREAEPGLPTSPLEPQLSPTGFRWARKAA